MENKIWDERSIDDVMLATKEKAIIDLYAKQNQISEESAEMRYLYSKLRNIVRDKESALYLESPYYILERYSEYMTPINVNRSINDMASYLPMVRPHILNQNFNVTGVEPLFFELVDLLNTPHYFGRVEQYRLRANGVRKHMIIAGSLGSGEETLASGFAERYKELGIISNGGVVEINLDGLLGKNIGMNSQYEDKYDLIMILSGNESKLENFMTECPVFKNDFTTVAQLEQYMPTESLKIYKNHTSHFKLHFRSKEEMSAPKKNTNIKSFLEMF